MQALIIGLPALVAGLLILASHVPLGQQVLKRGIVFIDLAIAQLAALGAIMAAQWHLGELFLGHDHSHGHAQLNEEWITLGVAILFSIMGSLLVAWINHNFPNWREAFIGLIYVSSASLLVLFVAGQPQGGQALTRTLSGDILWLSWSDLIPLAVMAILIQLVSIFRSEWLDRFFYFAFAVTITLSVTQAGIYLVFASLIAPALAAEVRGRSIMWAYFAGVTGFVGGLTMAWSLDLPAAATIVLSLIASMIFVLLLQATLDRSRINKIPNKSTHKATDKSEPKSAL
jgi:zinc/manganese transport system permease protein